MSTLKHAIEIANKAHVDQTDKAGEPYVLHLYRVMNMGKTEEEKICGVLHDLVEDTSWSFDDLRNEGFSSNVIEAIQCVTKLDRNESYTSFIDRVAQNPLAIRIKLNDLTDNMDIRRLSEIKDKDVERLNRYITAYRKLTAI